jgi:hypothetical protein
LERENRFTGLVHRLDVVLESLRGNYGTEPPVITNDYSYTSGHSDPRNPRYKGGGLRSDCADANCSIIAGFTVIADVDIVTARDQLTGLAAQCDVAAARGVKKNCASTPIAVLPLPVVLKTSASTPVAVFKEPVVLYTSAATPVAVFQ